MAEIVHLFCDALGKLAGPVAGVALRQRHVPVFLVLAHHGFGQIQKLRLRKPLQTSFRVCLRAFFKLFHFFFGELALFPCLTARLALRLLEGGSFRGVFFCAAGFFLYLRAVFQKAKADDLRFGKLADGLNGSQTLLIPVVQLLFPFLVADIFGAVGVQLLHLLPQPVPLVLGGIGA